MKTHLRSLLVMGGLLVALMPLPAPAQVEELSSPAQVELNVGTSAVQTLPSPLPNQLNVLPPPPAHVLREISRDSDPSTTLDVPLSLMGEQILEAVCDAQIPAGRALSLMPDLSPIHIQQQCPEQLAPETSSLPPT